MSTSELSTPRWRIPTGKVVTSLQQRERFWPLAVFGLMLGSVLLWLPSLTAPLDIDAACYAVAAHWWARGEGLYHNFTITRPQGIFVVFRLIQTAGLDSVAGMRIAGALYCALCGLLLFLVAGRVWGKPIALGAAWLFALIMALPTLDGTATNAELYMLLPLLVSLLLLLRADETPLGSRVNLLLLAGCGLSGAVALLFKPSGIAALGLAAVWLLRRRFRERTSWLAWLRAEFTLGATFLLGLVPSLIHGLLIAPDTYLYAILFYRVETASAVSSSLLRQLGRFVYVTGQILVDLPILVLAVIGWAAVPRMGDARARDLLYLWTLVSLGGAWLGGNWWVHYYQQLVPPLAVALALGLRHLIRETKPGLGFALQRCLAVLGVVALAATLLLALTIRNDSRHVLASYTPTDRWYEAAAAYLQQHADPNDTLYVVYDRVQIYYLSSLRPAVIWPHHIDLRHVPGAFDGQVALMNDPATAPTYIVAEQPFDEFGLDTDGAMRAIVARDYTLEATVAGIPIYRRSK